MTKEKKEENKLDKIKGIINNSGNNFHYQVVNFLREKDWSVLVSPYYTDNITDKPREIDIIAEKAYPINYQEIHSLQWNVGTLNVRLFIECKYINNDIVFWFDEKDKERVIKKITTDTPLNHPDENITINEHHYMKSDEKVAKLFATNNKDDDVIYKALNQNLNAMIYHKGKPPIIPKDDNRAVNIFYTLNYLLVVCNDFSKFYTAEDDPKNITNNFLLEVNYAYLSNQIAKSEFFLIDLIDFQKFGDFLKEIEEKDIKIVKNTISNRRRLSYL